MPKIHIYKALIASLLSPPVHLHAQITQISINKPHLPAAVASMLGLSFYLGLQKPGPLDVAGIGYSGGGL